MQEYRIERDFQTALDYTSMALEKTPKNSQLQMNSGLIKRRLLRWDDALDDFRKTLERDPANMITQVAYARTLEDVEGETDVITNNGQLLNMAVALAILGDTLSAWDEIKLLIDQPNGVTAWDLKLRPDFRQWFHGIPQYQQIVDSLK